ncbi:hypothetical protein [Nocardiopsis sp. ATB16-24]|uniref:hypothetical protein n=1 Tax=Nocardiopsis sp. ATB16-24 TaxID=3019555 RepID=UPI0025559900|nr:hypothetical protein [Nocardiopsis sp. ATB16-24]
MSENRQTPLDRGRFATTMGRLTVYSQNNPEQYGFRMALVGAVLTVVLWVVFFGCLLMGESSSTVDLLIVGGGAVVMIGLSALGGFVTARATRRIVKGRPVPSDSDPARVQAAHWQIMRGALHQDAEVNRIGRILAEQHDASKAPQVAIVVVALAVPMHAAGIALRYDGSPLALFHVLMVVVMTVMVVALVPVTMRRRRGVRRFRELHDLTFPESS